MTTDDHTHPSPAHKAGCPVCNPDKTVPELNDAYRASKPLCKHDWVGNDDCAYCRIDCLRAALIEAREYILDNGDERTMAPVVQRIDDAAYDLRQPVETTVGKVERGCWLSNQVPRCPYYPSCACGNAEKTEAEHPDTRRLRWLANTVLFCDYGDNSAKQIGWRVYEFIAPLMYGASINEAIDAAMPPKEQPPRRRSAGDVKTSSDSARLDWALRNVSGLEWRRLGIEYSAGMTRDDLDKRIALDVKAGQ